MNYCTNCGNKLNNNTKFCTNCGKEVKREVENTSNKKVPVKEQKEFNVNNLVLYVGVSLVILATLIFAVCTWENMSGLFKISFLTFETLLFFIISFTFAKIKNNGLSKAFYLLAVMMIPIIFYTIPVYGLLGDYLSYKGAGIFVYLAISNIICASIYLLSYFLLRTKAFTFISYTFIYAGVVNAFLAFEQSIPFLIISSLVFILVVIIINFIVRKDSFFKRSLTIFTSILFSLLSVFMIFAINVAFSDSYFYSFNSLNLYLILITVLFLANTYVFIYQNRKSIYTYVSPYVIVPVVSSILICVVDNRVVLASLISTSCLAIYALFLLFKSKYLYIAGKAVTYVSLIIMIIFALIRTAYYYESYLSLAICGLCLLGFNIINRFKEDFKWVSDSIIPFSCIFVVYGFIKYYVSIPNIFIVLLLAAIFLVVYMILKALKKPINKIYYLYSFACLIVSMLMCTYGTEAIYIIFLNVLLAILFIFVSFMEKLNFINVITFIVLCIALLQLKVIFGMDIRIILACISLLAIVVGIIIKSSKNVLSKFYLYFGEILSLLLALTITSYTTYIVIALISVLFIVSFISICLFNNTKAFRIIAEMIGLILIYLIVNALIDVTLFSTIISLFIYMVFLVILGLTKKEKTGTIIILSTVCLIPYYDYALSYSTGIENQLVIIPFIVYLFIMTFYFKLSYKARMHTIIWPLIVFSIIAINTTIIGIIIALSLALIYIFIGIFKKYKYLVIFGIVYLFVIIVFELFKMFNNLALLIAVLLIGLSLIIYVVINEIIKSKKNK